MFRDTLIYLHDFFLKIDVFIFISEAWHEAKMLLFLDQSKADALINSVLINFVIFT